MQVPSGHLGGRERKSLDEKAWSSRPLGLGSAEGLSRIAPIPRCQAVVCALAILPGSSVSAGLRLQPDCTASLQ